MGDVVIQELARNIGTGPGIHGVPSNTDMKDESNTKDHHLFKAQQDPIMQPLCTGQMTHTYTGDPTLELRG